MKYTIKEAMAMTSNRRQYLKRKGHEVPDLPRGVKPGYQQTPEHAAKRKRFGKDHHSWKGDDITARSGRTRAERLFPVIGKCVLCEKRKAERHHIDGNTANNDPSNILPVCRRCHMVLDGRLQRFAEMGIANLRRLLEENRAK